MWRANANRPVNIVSKQPKLRVQDLSRAWAVVANNKLNLWAILAMLRERIDTIDKEIS